jgi:hypothetical protein
MVNWRAIGRAKKRLKLSPSVRTTKMMYEWLNVGSQKKKMGGDGICPCCGIEEEDHSTSTVAPMIGCRAL